MTMRKLVTTGLSVMVDINYSVFTYTLLQEIADDVSTVIKTTAVDCSGKLFFSRWNYVYFRSLITADIEIYKSTHRRPFITFIPGGGGGGGGVHCKISLRNSL